MIWELISMANCFVTPISSKSALAGGTIIAKLLLGIALLLSACDNPTEPPGPPTPTPCIDYSTDSTYPGGGYMYPVLRYKEGKLSSDGKTFAYRRFNPTFEQGESTDGKLYFCDLETGKQTELPPLSWQNGVRYNGIYNYQWCPYDPNLLVVSVYTTVDTSGNINEAVESKNSYIVNREGKIIRRVTPSIFPWYGAQKEYEIVSWYSSSTPQADSLLSWSPYYETVIYIPQLDTTVTPTYYPFSMSRDGKRWYGSNDIVIPFARAATYMINWLPFKFEGSGHFFYVSSFSPSGKYLAVEGLPTPQYLYNEYPNVWIIDIDSWLINPSENAPIVSKLSFRRDFCTYADPGAAPVFITDTTLAVSMYPAFAHISHYYEVGIYGTYIRQLSGKY
jgi:hypothetical protein